MSGRLYVVSTPIGNLEDITYRAVRVLKEAHWIACEDTRTTRRLLDHYGIETRTISYHEHNETERAAELIERIEQGESGALVSDAGTPLLSDPGYRLVHAAAQAGVRIEPLPGASALLAALVVSGLPTDQFHFGGFLPPKQGQRQRLLESLADEAATLIFYEAPHRILESLEDIAVVLGTRDIVAARELTKMYEEVLRGTASDIAATLSTRDSIRGEFVILIGKSLAPPVESVPIGDMIQALIAAGVERMEAMKTVARERGLSKRDVYKLLSGPASPESETAKVIMGTLFFCIALLVFAQDDVDPVTESFSVDGTVVDATTRVPIPGARVFVHYQTSEAVLQEVSTGVNGAFHFSIGQPGQYVVEANKDAYLSALEKLPEGKTTIPSVILALAGSIAIRGRVRDGETEKGLPGLTVTALRVTYWRGSRQLIDDRTAFTDDEGDFLLDQLKPGDYFLEIKKFPPGTILPGSEPDTPAEAAAPSRYPQTIWPASAALTASLLETNIGNVDLTKVKPGRIRGEVIGLDCKEEAIYGLSILQRFGDRVIEERGASIPCDSAFTLSNLSAGDYVVRAMPPGPFQFASADVRIEPGSDLDIRLQLRELPRIFGSVSFDCKSDCSGVATGLFALLEPMFRSFSNDPAEIASSSTVNENGQFRALMPLLGPVRISLRPLPGPLFIQRVIYDGADVGTTFMPDGAATETLQIVLSDEPLELNGAVQRDGQPVANANVVLSSWPLVGNDAWAAATIVKTDSGGRFSFHNLRAGTYRAVSPLPSDWERKDQPGILAGFFAAAEDITLSATESGFVILK